MLIAGRAALDRVVVVEGVAEHEAVGLPAAGEIASAAARVGDEMTVGLRRAQYMDVVVVPPPL
ncbi:MAG TPA: hypothetical protein VGF56_08910 [Rhizomicrobium sp.]|jgi:hypothetical protein